MAVLYCSTKLKSPSTIILYFSVCLGLISRANLIFDIRYILLVDVLVLIRCLAGGLFLLIDTAIK